MAFNWFPAPDASSLCGTKYRCGNAARRGACCRQQRGKRGKRGRGRGRRAYKDGLYRVYIPEYRLQNYSIDVPSLMPLGPGNGLGWGVRI